MVLPALRVLECGFQLGVIQLCTNLSLKLPICNNLTAYSFSVGRIVYWVGNGQV